MKMSMRWFGGERGRHSAQPSVRFESAEVIGALFDIPS